MGFGFLFIGYFFLIFYPLDSVGILPNLSVIGCIFMFAAMGRLMRYCPDNKAFKAAKISLIPLSVFSLAMLALNAVKSSNMLTDELRIYFAEPLSIVSKLAVCVFTVLLFIGIYRLSNEVELPKLASASAKRITITGVWGTAMAFSGIFSIVITAGTPVSSGLSGAVFYIGLFSMLLEYLCIIINLALIFSCYARICLEGDEDMPYREDIFDKIIAWTKRNKQ